MKSSTGQIKLPSTLDMGTTVPIAITGWEQSGMQHNINLSVPRQGDRNELLAKVAKRAERAQLLVMIHYYYIESSTLSRLLAACISCNVSSVLFESLEQK